MPRFFKASKEINESPDDQIETHSDISGEQLNEIKCQNIKIPSKKGSNFRLKKNPSSHRVKIPYDNWDYDSYEKNIPSKCSQFNSVIIDCSPINFIDTVGVYTLKLVSYL